MEWYIGFMKDVWVPKIFSAADRPTKSSYPQFIKVFGPFYHQEDAENYSYRIIDKMVYQENPIERSQQWKDTHRPWTPEEKKEHKKFLKAREQQRRMKVSGPIWTPRPVQEYAEGMYDPYYQSNPTEAVDIPSGVSEDELEIAAEVYEKFHDFGPTKLEEVDIPRPKVLVKIGDFTAVGYFSPKWKFKRKLKQTHRGDKGQHYLHEYKDQADSMVAFAPDPGNPEYGMLIAWRRCRLTQHGLEDNK